MRKLQSLAVWIVVPVVIWCVWLQGQFNSLVAKTEDARKKQSQALSDLRNLELALGLIRERILERDGLSRLSVIESRIQAIENELLSQPVGTLIQVVQPQTQTIADADPEATKTRKTEINEYVPKLKEEMQKALEQFYWRPAENGNQMSAREYPEASRVYSRHPSDTGGFTLNPPESRTFVRLKQFRPAADGRFDVGVFQIPRSTPVGASSTEPAKEASPPK
jgi:hypothetical protein